MHQFIVSPRRPILPVPELKGAGPQDASRPVRRAATLPAAAPVVPTAAACRVVRQIVLEMTALASDRPLRRRDSRRAACHGRQLAMYVCHVVLQFSLSEIGAAFGRDRTTVGHACNVVEDRRDDAGFDAFVSAIERLVIAVFGPAGIGSHG